MITDRQILLVKNSWSYIVTDSEDAGQLFYQRLFEVAPSVKHMFASDTREQSRKLMNMVTLIVTKLQNLNEIMDGIRGLAQRHGKYGAKPEHYAIVGECLVWTLQQGLGDRWNNETEEAWTVVYGVLSDAMIKNQPATVVL